MRPLLRRVSRRASVGIFGARAKPINAMPGGGLVPARRTYQGYSPVWSYARLGGFPNALSTCGARIEGLWPSHVLHYTKSALVTVIGMGECHRTNYDVAGKSSAMSFPCRPVRCDSNT